MSDINSNTIDILIQLVEDELLPRINIKSPDPHDPVEIENLPKPWKLLGVGNYAAALYHPDFNNLVVKVYAEGRPGIWEETEVYKRLGKHPSYSECFYRGKNYLILKRLMGITLYDCIRKGIQIPEKIIMDIDAALDYAKSRKLHPHDVHFKNVMMLDGNGIVVDVSDFCKEEYCSLWKHSKKAYYKVYLPFMFKFHPPIPEFILNAVRKCYQIYRKLTRIR